MILIYGIQKTHDFNVVIICVRQFCTSSSLNAQFNSEVFKLSEEIALLFRKLEALLAFLRRVQALNQNDSFYKYKDVFLTLIQHILRTLVANINERLHETREILKYDLTNIEIPNMTNPQMPCDPQLYEFTRDNLDTENLPFLTSNEALTGQIQILRDNREDFYVSTQAWIEFSDVNVLFQPDPDAFENFRLKFGISKIE